MLLKLNKTQVKFLKSFDAITVKLHCGSNIYETMSYTHECHWVLGNFIDKERIEIVK